MSKWKEYKLGNFIDSVSDTFKFTDSSVVFLNTSDIYDGKILTNQLSDPKTLPGQAKKKIAKNDILYSEIRPANKRFAIVNINADNYVVSTKLMVLRSKGEIDVKYLYLYLTAPDMLEYLQMIAEDRSGTFPQITFDNISSLDILLPPLSEQKQIAEVLGSLDDKIDLLNRQNATLEQMAETLFRKWFIEDAKDDWGEKPLSSIADFLNGLACQNYPPRDNIHKLPVLKIKELSSGISAESDWATTEIPSAFSVKNGDVIFAWSASLMVKIWNGEQCILNQHLFKVTSKDYPLWFYYMWCKQHLQEFQIIAESHATTMGHIKRSDLDTAMVLVPTQQELLYMTEEIQPLINREISNNKQLNTLNQLRNTLLPKLMSEEVGIIRKRK
jgi:type I restriction enzyme, S subunit